MKKRAVILTIFILFSFSGVALRLIDIMLINHEWFSERARVQQIKKEDLPVKRGIIYDRRGRELALNLDTASIYADPQEIASPEKVAFTLSEVINQNPGAILSRIRQNKRFNWIERKGDIERMQRVKDLKLKGIGFINESKRYYTKGILASHIIGFVDIDNRGLEGIEQRYDGYLSAKSEKTLMLRDAKGNVLSEGLSREIRGNDILLTIDEGLQHILEKNLDAAVAKWRAASATAIMMNPYTGEVLAMANRPTFDPNDPSGSGADRRRNRAITDCYEPGSTFKIVVGAAALEEGAVNTETKFDCSAGYIEVGGNKIKDAHRQGVLTFKEVIQKSSNVGAVKIGLNLGKEKVYEYIKRFDFGERAGIDLTGEVSCWVRPPEKWSKMSIGALSIGYEIAVTPLQILRAYSSIANGGFLVKPHVVSEVMAPGGNVLYKAAPEAKRVISERTADTLREILGTITEVGGTAVTAAVDGNQVAGKTGTARLLDQRTKRYSTEKYISSFVGFVPADSPRIAMVIVVHEPRGAIYGGVVAGPVFKGIADEALSYLRVPRDDYREKGLLLVSKNR